MTSWLVPEVSPNLEPVDPSYEELYGGRMLPEIQAGAGPAV